MRELSLSAASTSDAKALEILRVWLKGDGGQGFVVRVDHWSDPAAWGLLLVDLARHVSNSYCQTRGGDPAAVLARIKDGFDAEWSAPTDHS